MYKTVDPKQSFPKMEEEVLAFWEKNDTFKKSIEQRSTGDDFVFYDGPPFATGLPHFGHFIPSTIKDIIPRYQTMRGKKVERRFGWDCHGLPVENLIEKELGLKCKTDIEKYGIAKFNEACRASVLRYTKEWRQVITRLGRWVDFDDDYKTMEPDYMETIWWVMKQLWDKGLLYEGHYILPYCPRCSTVLSNHEVAGSYIDVQDTAITVRFKTSRKEEGGGRKYSLPEDGEVYILAWTTTPWTLPSNQAVAIGPDIDYVLIKDNEVSTSSFLLPTYYIMAEARISAYYKSPDKYSIIWKKKGKELAGIEYEPLFPYFKTALEKDNNEAALKKTFQAYLADYVSTEEGTGIVHIANGFGEDDANVLKGTGIPTFCPVDAECRFTDQVWDYKGLFVKDADKPIMERLKAEGKLVKREQITHSYPHCWRCDHPLIYRAISSWFVNVPKIRDQMVEANQQISWQPEHIKNGRFGKWLEGAREWAISRSRYWGNPLPIWRCEKCGKTICVGSRAELEKLSGVYPKDLHKHFVDDITFKCDVVSTSSTTGAGEATGRGSVVEPVETTKHCDGTMHRVPDVLDCWFESGSMPYGQVHYPFENKEKFESHFPANFISESLDQTRGWFYSLHVLATALFGKPAFQNCIVSGMVLAKDGKKMSKHLNNYTDPVEVLNTYGADSVRLLLVHSALIKADDLRFSDDAVRDVLKSIIIPLWNAYSFFITYANIDGAKPTGAPENPANPLDKWILSATENLVEKVENAMDAYDLSKAVDPILEFIDLLNNWYIRRSRRRFWRSENDEDKLDAYGSLYQALKTLIKVAAPFMPFITEAIWQNLRLENEPESVHLCNYPIVHAERRDAELEFKMAAVQHAVSMGRALRSTHNIKVRQPLNSIELVTRNVEEKKALLEMTDIIAEELNVKEVRFSDNEEDLVSFQAKANFKVLGKELGKDMKAAAEKIEAFTQAEIAGLLEGATLSIEINDRSIDITADKLDIRRIEKANLKVLNEGSLTVGLDTEVTQALAAEGDARDLVRGVQNLRKDTGLEVTDRISLCVFGSDKLKTALEAFKDYIAAETLATDISWGQTANMTEIEAGDDAWHIALTKTV
ncbi:MAG: isoleucine--tRNA ligase [Spirochaetaceae bacterium]|jgi:isoleucyl-tRNA synthetase|nr:isoleucine--tRNA ligase [Spirochaetaceae bacterium]